MIMAVDYNEMKKKFQDPKLSNEELKIIEAAEKFIDKKIESEMRSSDDIINVDESICNFTGYYSENSNFTKLHLGRDRRLIMSKELKNRYLVKNWNVEYSDSYYY